MALVTLDEGKRHLRVYHSQDDALISFYIDAAEGHMAAIGVVLTDGPAPASLKAAILLHLGHLYETREAVTEGRARVVPMGYDALTAPFRPIEF